MPARILPLLQPARPEEAVEKVVTHFGIGTYWLRQGELRLDASYYALDAFQAQRAIEESRWTVKPLEALVSKMFNLPRFKRIYTSEPGQGYPYLSANDVLMFRPKPDRYLAKENLPEAGERHFVEPGWILMTCSGTVGRLVITGARLQGVFLTHDLIRIIPQNPETVGYLYAFLASSIGQPLISKDRYGSAIEHLEPHHLALLPVPLLTEAEQKAIHEKVMEAYRLRGEANALLDEAERLLYQELRLPVFDDSKVFYLGGLHKPKCFSVRASELAERLDASYHIPVARTVVSLIQRGKYPLARLGDLARRIFIPPRFKRIYVAAEYGVPFLQGSHIMMMKPYDLKHVSTTANQEEIQRCLIHQGEILVTRSGTVGRVAYVPAALEGWAASEHILRIIPENKNSHSGYIAIFLMTPYGQHQLTSKIYGGVVDELTEQDTSAVLIPVPPKDVQQRIGESVVAAFEKKEQANRVETQAIARLEAGVQQKVVHVARS